MGTGRGGEEGPSLESICVCTEVAMKCVYLLHGLHTQTLGSGSGWAQAALRPQENRTASPHVDAKSKLLLEKTKGFP